MTPFTAVPQCFRPPRGRFGYAFAMQTIQRPLFLFASLLITAGLGACGVQEASAMTKLADQMCACKDMACVEKVYPEVEAESKKNEGKEIAAPVADKYNAELTRVEGCVSKIEAEAQKADAAAQ